MSPFPSGVFRPAPTLALVLLATVARPEVVLDVSGLVVASSPRLEVRVTLTNPGDLATGPVDVVGELFGERREAHLPGGIAPAAEGHLVLDFATAPPRPGRHALTLLVEHPVQGAPDAGGNPPMASQRAFLMLALGADPDAALRIAAEPLRLDVRGSLLVRLESADGTPYRVRLRALTARGLRPDADPIEVLVPAQGHATAQLPIVRAGSPQGRQSVLLVAENLDGPLARTAVAAAAVDPVTDAARLPGLRTSLLWGGLTLVLLALAYETRERLRARHPPAA